MRPDVLYMAAEWLDQAVEHYREAVVPPGGTAPASAAPVAVSSEPRGQVKPGEAQPALSETPGAVVVH